MPRTIVQTIAPGVELATYHTEHHGERVVLGARVDGEAHLYDPPAAGNAGRRYLVERRLTNNVELQALIADYLATAERLGDPPMHGWL
jgi:hypothetical protein